MSRTVKLKRARSAEASRKKDGDTIVILPARDSAKRKRDVPRARGRGRGRERTDGDGIVRSSRWERRARRVDRRCKEVRASPVSAHGYRRWRAGVAWRDEGKGRVKERGTWGEGGGRGRSRSRR